MSEPIRVNEERGVSRVGSRTSQPVPRRASTSLGLLVLALPAAEMSELTER